jgi:dolichol-phosphate mannosyltransferase
MLGVPIRDLTGGYNGWRREVLVAIGLDQVTSTGYCFQIELRAPDPVPGPRARDFQDERQGLRRGGGAGLAAAAAQARGLNRGRQGAVKGAVRGREWASRSITDARRRGVFIAAGRRTHHGGL